MSRLTIALALLFSPSIAMLACKCVTPPPDVATFRALAEWESKHAQVIFEGKVERIKVEGWPIKPVAGQTLVVEPHLMVTFSDTRTYRGEPSNQFTVETGLGMGDCGFAFQTGNKYLVYAWTGESGILQTGICSGTARIEQAGAELRFVRGEPAIAEDLNDWRATQSATSGGSICGRISMPERARPEVAVILYRIEPDPLPFRFEEGEMSADGSYCVKSLSAGDYLVTAVESEPSHRRFRYFSYYPGTTVPSHAKAVKVGDDETISGLNFSILRQPLYNLRGQVAGEHGRDVKVALVDRAFDAKSSMAQANVESNGSFWFDQVPPGRYSLFAFVENEDDTITFASAAVDIEIDGDLNHLTLQLVPKK